jgi:hypothetical protein
MIIRNGIQNIQEKCWFLLLMIFIYQVTIFVVKEISSFLNHKEISVNETVGFENGKVKYSKYCLSLWYLTSKNRHLWRHHYVGVQGVILIFSLVDETNEKLIVVQN